MRHGILEDYHEADFSGFPIADKKGTIIPERQAILTEVLEYASNLPNARKEGISIFLYGANGVGKTHLAVSIQKMAIRAGFKTQFANLSGIIKLLAKSWYDDEAAEMYERRVKNVDFLVIDDVGKEYKAKNNDLVEVSFDELIRYRSNRRLPFILTSNTKPEQMKDSYGNSVVSLVDGRCIKILMEGPGFPDWRKVVQAKELKDRLLGRK